MDAPPPTIRNVESRVGGKNDLTSFIFSTFHFSSSFSICLITNFSPSLFFIVSYHCVSIIFLSFFCFLSAHKSYLKISGFDSSCGEHVRSSCRSKYMFEILKMFEFEFQGQAHTQCEKQLMKHLPKLLRRRNLHNESDYTAECIRDSQNSLAQ